MGVIIEARTAKEFQDRLQVMIENNDPTLNSATVTWKKIGDKMKSYNVSIVFKDESSEETRVCGTNPYDAMDVVRDFVFDCKRNMDEIKNIELEQVYDEDDHREYGDNYEW